MAETETLSRCLALRLGALDRCQSLHLLRRLDVPEDCAAALARGLSLDEWTQEMIQAALLEQRGNKSAAARRLGITRRALDYRLARGEEE